MTSASLDMGSLLLLVARMWILRPRRVWVAPVDLPKYTNFTQGLSKDWCENMIGGCRA